jgi:erythromycin esterase
MPHYAYPTLDQWATQEAIPFSLDAPQRFDAAVDQMVALLGGAVELLGFGEALHGGKEILLLRNRLFQRLVEAHGYSAIAVESSFPRARVIYEYIAGDGAESYDTIKDTGFSHGFGQLDANRELVEWMRRYNGDPSHHVALHFYGFDSPTEMMGTDSPRQALDLALDYLASMDGASAQEYRERIEPLLGQDADWENPAAMMDPTQSVGRSPAANALRIATEDLIADLRIRRPELVAKSDESRYLEAAHYAAMARQLLQYHAVLAERSEQRIARGLGARDAMMADNLAYIVSHERSRGRVLAFAHNSHLKRGQAQWQLGENLLIWWPAGAQLDEMFASRYAVIGSAVGVSDEIGIGQPEAGSLEALLTATPGPARFTPTHKGEGLPASDIAALPMRSGSKRNSSYFALTPQSISDFDWLAALDSIAHDHSGPPLQP